MAIAILLSFVAITIVKCKGRTAASWLLRLVVAIPLFAMVVWLVFQTIPDPFDPGMPTFSIVTSAVVIAGLAAEELIGSEVRTLLGI